MPLRRSNFLDYIPAIKYETLEIEVRITSIWVSPSLSLCEKVSIIRLGRDVYHSNASSMHRKHGRTESKQIEGLRLGSGGGGRKMKWR